MVALVFPALPTVTLPVTGRTERFPVRRIFCVGRNYAEHTKEMGGDPEKEAPFFFTKPADAVVESGSRIPYPPATQNLHHEGELVVAIGKGGKMVSEEAAQAMIWGHAAGNDLTRRDLQADAKERRPAGRRGSTSLRWWGRSGRGRCRGPGCAVRSTGRCGRRR
jgi:fumarylpyruvate hydrolase